MVASPALIPSSHDSIVADDGIVLATQRWHGARVPELVFAHGFGQTRHAWQGAARTLAANGFAATTFDARGHGESEHVPRGDYHMEQFVADLVRVAAGARSSDGRAPVLVGASMGGLLGLIAAGEAPAGAQPFSALILVDITPRWETAGVERILGFMRSHPDGFAGYDEAASAIEAYLPHRRERKTEAQLKPLLRQCADGRLRWHWDPALLDGLVEESERYQPRLFAAAARVEVPVLLLSGARSDVVSGHTVDEFLRLVPHARHVALAEATHMVAGDANDAFTREIAAFMQTL
ncbi:Lysophospholipase, alpha-beta hydrolase superfamily [Luteibacter sp. UNCMF331Sha3.1]|uniref:alpha/beta hydrolase n=1 Tax=Luteibacter sp. UNCMF331Sha3.1 TaxID=1502760 RepID=UPI0008C93C09|nr:alpha/beta hydrolase [Luteibacter sp. UNCMF331Sha3.1]SEM85699.1 Lysophospholipase, alpha-beta hydrolase superfamily [Luteibacter sp. UNCMF331Sha3.1]